MAIGDNIMVRCLKLAVWKMLRPAFFPKVTACTLQIWKGGALATITAIRLPRFSSIGPGFSVWNLAVLSASVTGLIAPSSAIAAPGEWPDVLKSQYIENACVPGIVGQGFEEAAARTFCTCFVSHVEANFSILEYDKLTAGRPDPNGDSVDRRLYEAAMACQPQ